MSLVDTQASEAQAWEVQVVFSPTFQMRNLVQGRLGAPSHPLVSSWTLACPRPSGALPHACGVEPMHLDSVLLGGGTSLSSLVFQSLVQGRPHSGYRFQGWLSRRGKKGIRLQSLSKCFMSACSQASLGRVFPMAACMSTLASMGIYLTCGPWWFVDSVTIEWTFLFRFVFCFWDLKNEFGA